ncbi:MAG: thioredoxin-related protein [Flavobacterium sp.]|jgi:thioredoxin-related protein
MKKLFSFFILFVSCASFSQNWQSNFNDAKIEAEKSQKNILLVFSGSDWCAPCIKLDRNIWQSPEFKKFSDENLILYKADFPKKKANQLSAELSAENQSLASKYNKDGNYPLVVILDYNGNVKAVSGYTKNPPADFIISLQSFITK